MMMNSRFYHKTADSATIHTLRTSSNYISFILRVDVKFSYGGEIERAKDILIG